MIIVGGASGDLGGRVLRHLVERTDAARVVALSRTPGRVPSGLGVKVRAADFDDPGGLLRALDGAERFLIISLDALTGRVPAHAGAIDAAVKAGTGHIVYTSMGRAGDPGHPLELSADHRETERLLAGAGPAFTSLRFNVWPEMLMMAGVAQRAVASGTLPSNSGPAGRVGYLAKDDSAAVAAAVLAEGAAKGEFLEVTGPRAVSDEELAGALAQASGRPVRYEPVTDGELPAKLIAQGAPPPLANAWAAAGAARRDGWFDVHTHAVERLTGRAPASITGFFTARRDELLAG